MQVAAPPLLPIFRSHLQGRLLAWLLPHPEREVTAAELAEVLGSDQSTVSRELNRLVQAGLLTERRIGRSRVVAAHTSSPYYEELSSLVLKAFGPAEALGEELPRIAGVDKVVVFGSWAARYCGETGPVPNDIDVLVVGTPDRTDVYRAARSLTDRLALDVHTVIVRPEDWELGEERLFKEIRGGHHVIVFDRARNEP